MNFGLRSKNAGASELSSAYPKVRRRLAGLLTIALLGLPGAETASAQGLPVRTIEPLVQGDEAIIVTKHKVQTSHGPLAYEARAGRLPIRNEQTGEVRGYMFFVAYHVLGRPEKRPLTFMWNGGPTAASWNFHTLGAGPRIRRDEGGFVDNPATLLADSDLVFMDAMETGFSRLAKPEFAPEFFQFQGDVAATVEFIRAYRTRFRAIEQPLYIGGTSYGVFRAAAAVDELSSRGVKVAGAILISGDIPNIPQPTEFYNAMHVPARTATAFYYKRLPPELMRDRAETMREALNWARTVYQPALARSAQLTNSEREAIALALARYTGISPELVNRKTLVVPVNTYLAQFLGGDLTRPLSDIDTRISDGSDDVWTEGPLDAYMRDELQYTTDLTYRGIERGYMPTPGPPAKTTRQQFNYNQPGMTAEAWQDLLATGEVTKIAQLNPPWIINAMKRDASLRVLVITGRYDPLNMCEGDQIVTATLPADLSGRIENHCYESGHIVYKNDEQRLELSRDFAKFVHAAKADK